MIDIYMALRKYEACTRCDMSFINELNPSFQPVCWSCAKHVYPEVWRASAKWQSYGWIPRIDDD